MWALRVLNGALAGKVFPLKSGRNLLGRANHCDILIQSNGISKEHCELHVYPDKIMVVDLKSSNGTYLNGVRIQNAAIRLGDKMTAHDIILEITPAQDPKNNVRQIIIRQNPAPMVTGNTAHQLQAYNANMQQQAEAAAQGKTPQHLQNQNIVESLMVQSQDYVERVAMPGVYKLAEWFDFRWVIGGFVVLFVFAVTLLAMIPTFRSAKESLMGESLRRAQSVARHLAEINQKALLEGQYGALSTHSAELEEGVEDVFIVQKSDGMVLAPASRAGRIPEQSFVHKARAEDRPLAGEISVSQIGASAPIGQYDPATGLPSVKAYAIVIYNVNGMALNESRAISLFMQILVLAAVIGSLLFFFLIKLIEKPIRELNELLDTAMRDRKDNIAMPYLYPALQALVGNVNSLLSRSLSSDSSGGMSSGGGSNPADRQQEAQGFVNISPGPAMALGADDIVWSMNEGFQKLVGQNCAGDTYRKIPDSSLQQNIESLIQKCKDNPYMSHSDNLEFSGHPCQIQMMAIHTSGHVEYYFLTIKPTGGES